MDDTMQIGMDGKDMPMQTTEPPKPSRKFKTMQQIHGILSGKICGDCAYFVRYSYHDKTFFKCREWRLSNSAATDIRKGAQACGIFRQRREDGSMCNYTYTPCTYCKDGDCENRRQDGRH